jgi:sec-independent protein translocase protein TatA
MGLKMPEILLILVALLVIFGPSKLGDLGGAIGRGIRNFKKEISGAEEDAAQASLQGANSVNAQATPARATEKQS